MNNFAFLCKGSACAQIKMVYYGYCYQGFAIIHLNVTAKFIGYHAAFLRISVYPNNIFILVMSLQVVKDAIHYPREVEWAP